MSESSCPERPFAFALPDSETSLFPMAGTIVDQIIALEQMGETDLANNLKIQTQEEIADAFAEEEAIAREMRKNS